MKVYVAARFTDKDKVKEVYTHLQEKGHTITADWTDHVNSGSYSDNTIRSQEYATQDLKGVNECDVFILLTSEKAGSGSSTELGAALARCSLSSVPHIYIVGKYNDVNMFYYHPLVKKVATVSEVIELLKSY